jgi:predicted nuclease of predicted toxin-antitoxin system
LKLLVDENLPPRLVLDLADLFPDSLHVNDAALSGSPDSEIWEYAKENGFAFVTKDKDFASLGMVRGAPPKVVLLQTGNCSTGNIIGIVRTNAIRIAQFQTDEKRSLLFLR